MKMLTIILRHICLPALALFILGMQECCGFRTVLADSIFKSIEEHKDSELVAILKRGQDPNSIQQDQIPALVYAWQVGNRSAFAILLEMGANLHQMIKQDLQIHVEDKLLSIKAQTPIIAVIVQYSRLRPGYIEAALRYVRLPNQVDASGRSVLHHHAISNLPANASDPILPLMVNCGVDTDLLDADGTSPVRYFAREFMNNSEIWEPSVLLESGIHSFASGGADLFKKSPDGSTLFDDLAQIANQPFKKAGEPNRVWSHQKSAELKEFFKNKTHPENKLFLTQIDVSKTTLSNFFEDPQAQEVCYWSENFPDVFDDMLTLDEYWEQGGKVDQLGKAGVTFLWAAFHAGNVQAFEQLLTRGADVDHRLTDDLVDHYEVIGPVENRIVYNGFFGVRGETVLLAACSYPYRRKEFIRPILALTKNVNQTDELGRNGLHRLLYHPLLEGQEECLVDLIRAKVNVNAQTISGATPCHVAVAMNPAVIPALVVSGADPSIRNMRNQTVEDLLRQAIQEGWSRQKEYQEVLDWLTTRKK